MKKILLFLLLAGLSWACSNADDSATARASMTRNSDTPDGKKIYKLYCVTCHGLYGTMGGSGAFDLTKSELKVEERVAVITNGRNAMTPFKSLLKPEQIQAVAEYTLELKK